MLSDYNLHNTNSSSGVLYWPIGNARQVCGPAGTIRDLQQRLSAAQQQAEDAQAAVAKSEADLEDLSGAYNTLEAHAFKLEGQLREQQRTGAHRAWQNRA